MQTWFVDSETCGLHSLPVLLQYAIDDGPIHTVDLWLTPFHETLTLLEEMVNHRFVGFNIAFDLFQINKLYNIWKLFKNETRLPIYMIDEIAGVEADARDGECFVPKEVVDLMIHARKGRYQSTQERKDIRIRAIPGPLAETLAKELDAYIRISDIHFARKKKKKHWHILESNKPGFADIVLKFAPSTALKALVVDAGIAKKSDILLFSEVAPDQYPVEVGYAPFATAISTKESRWRAYYKVGRKTIKSGFTWPGLIELHVRWWQTHPQARTYAENDVDYTRKLYHYFDEPGETNDSILAAYVAATRWKGFAIDVQGIIAAREAALSRVTTRVDPNSVRKRLLETLGPLEKAVLVAQNKTGISTNKVVLEALAKMGNAYAKEVLSARKALKEIELYDKLLLAGRLHASFKVAGTLSNRMAGADGLNAQAINSALRVKALFPLAFFVTRTPCPGCKKCLIAQNNMAGHGIFSGGEQLDHGDFESFEVVIAECIYQDENLRRDLLTCEDCAGLMEPKGLSFVCTQCKGGNAKKIHALMGMALYPGHDYEQVKKSKGINEPEIDMYTNGKRGVFALLYGGTAFTIATKIGIATEIAEQALIRFIQQYTQVGVARSEVQSRFTALRQPNGIGTRVSYSEPCEHVENIYGFRRYFTLENIVIRRLFELSQNLPGSLVMAGKKLVVTRRDREQTGDNAVKTALLAAAFAQQQANVRAAQNTVIQSSGAESTKDLQVRIATVQPRGIHNWVVRVMQVHDSLESVCDGPETSAKIVTIVNDFVTALRERVPLLGIDWATKVNSWAD